MLNKQTLPQQQLQNTTTQGLQTINKVRQACAEINMATVEKHTKQNCGKPIQCTDNHHYRSEMVPGITTEVSYIPIR